MANGMKRAQRAAWAAECGAQGRVAGAASPAQASRGPRGRPEAGLARGAGGEHPTEPDGAQSGADEGSPASSR